ncbi:helix-turn-helix domain-containing protein [Arthrobacter woluwensis]|uniref:DNA-binding transcriptional regulator, XRE-family HTH domain n=1 Tax=Arthrobacter woluwensis TaxID=156980 RepID=A0A1H4JRA9_9MICC|nr:helix-turn-helix transcriptional regulator [Arthrobacter woluwensis]SEB48793.1 DNA-binding transcriptional regulator, XRE-family HTH domain [Arthrobacter woluwensis]
MGRIFGQRLRAQRISKGLTQEELGGSECSHSYISLLERGAREPSSDIVLGLARRLGMAAEDLEQWMIQPTVQDQEYSLAALHAWCAWDARDYEMAAHHALVAAQFARESHRDATVCEMNLLRAECLARLGRYEQGRNLVEMLLADGLVASNVGLRSEVLQLSARMALAQEEFHEAVAHAQEGASGSAALPDDSMVRHAACHLHIRALLSEGHKEAAWRGCEVASRSHSAGVPSHERGRLAWVMGDVAFARGCPERGIEHHEQAARLLLPQVDLEEWVAFNISSARARLEAGIADEATRVCLDRAVAAQEVLGLGQENDREFAFLDGLWMYTRRCYDQALEALAVFTQHPRRMSRLSTEALFLRGRIQLSLALPQQALTDLALAQEGYFRQRDLRGAQTVADLILEISRTRYEDAPPVLAHSAAS